MHAERDLMEEVESLQKQICRMQEQHDATDTQHDSAERQLAKQVSSSAHSIGNEFIFMHILIR